MARERATFVQLIVAGLPDATARPALRVALEGRFSYTEGVCIDWLAAAHAVDPDTVADPAVLDL